MTCGGHIASFWPLSWLSNKQILEDKARSNLSIPKKDSQYETTMITSSPSGPSVLFLCTNIQILHFTGISHGSFLKNVWFIVITSDLKIEGGSAFSRGFSVDFPRKIRELHFYLEGFANSFFKSLNEIITEK